MDMQKIAWIKDHYKRSVFVAVDHGVTVYFADDKSFVSGRGFNPSYTLRDDARYSVKKTSLEKNQALSVIREQPIETTLDNLPLQLPSIERSNRYPINYLDYDIIIVSDIYARYAVIWEQNKNFLDRLYVGAAAVFSSAIDERGVMGLRKVVYPNGCGYFNPYEKEYNPIRGYLNEFACGRTPSLAAVIQLIDYFIATNNFRILNSRDFDDLVDFVYEAVRRNPRYSDNANGNRVYYL